MTQAQFRQAGKPITADNIAMHMQLRTLLAPAMLAFQLRHANKPLVYLTTETDRGQTKTVLHISVANKHNNEQTVYTADLIFPRPLERSSQDHYIPFIKIRGTDTLINLFSLSDATPAINAIARIIDHDIASSKSFGAAKGYRVWTPPEFGAA